MTRPRNRCPFCREHGSSEEDVFALWITEAVGGVGVFNFRGSHSRSKSGIRRFGVTTRAVCRPCNTGWLSRLEDTVKPLLTPVIQGKPHVWQTGNEQLAVGTWIFKTALTLSRSSLKMAEVPEEHFRYLWFHRRPPDSVRVSLGHYLPNSADDLMVGRSHSATIPAAELEAAGADCRGRNAYRYTFSIGNAIFQVYGYPGTKDQGIALSRGIEIDEDRYLEDVFREIWPLTIAPHEWPPRVGFNSAGLLDLTPEPID